MAFERPKTLEQIAANVQEDFNKEQATNATTINGKKYKIKPLGAKQGLTVWENLVTLIGPSIGVGIDSFNHNEIIDGSPTTFSEAIMLLQRKLDGFQLVNYSDELLVGLQCDGQEVKDWDAHFSANYGEWTQVIIFALKENFQSFFVESGLDLNLQGIVSKVLPQLQSSSE